MERLLVKYSDKDRVPTAYERFCWLVNFLYPYFKTFKTLMTIFTPSKYLKFELFLVLILIWYAKNFKRITRTQYQQ